VDCERFLRHCADEVSCVKAPCLTHISSAVPAIQLCSNRASPAPSLTPPLSHGSADVGWYTGRIQTRLWLPPFETAQATGEVCIFLVLKWRSIQHSSQSQAFAIAHHPMSYFGQHKGLRDGYCATSTLLDSIARCPFVSFFNNIVWCYSTYHLSTCRMPTFLTTNEWPTV
jgi:hypothetical protein